MTRPARPGDLREYLCTSQFPYHVGKGDGSFILFAGAPSIVLQGLLVALIPASLTGVAQMLFALNAVLLVAGVLFATVRVSAALSSRRRAAAAARS